MHTGNNHLNTNIFIKSELKAISEIITKIIDTKSGIGSKY
jgi:hypothetical protein